MRIIAQGPRSAAFAPYGAFLWPPADVGGRSPFSEWLTPIAGLSQQCHLNRVRPSHFPVRVAQVERHPHAKQLFLPMGVSRYLVTVMPSDDEGAPDPGRAKAFIVPGSVGVAYHRGTWHAGIAVLDREATFAVMMWRGGSEDDVFRTIDPIEVSAQPLPTGERTRG